MKEIYISMDTKDVELLKEQLDRANSKAKSLESVIKKTTPKTSTIPLCDYVPMCLCAFTLRLL